MSQTSADRDALTEILGRLRASATALEEYNGEVTGALLPAGDPMQGPNIYQLQHVEDLREEITGWENSVLSLLEHAADNSNGYEKQREWLAAGEELYDRSMTILDRKLIANLYPSRKIRTALQNNELTTAISKSNTSVVIRISSALQPLLKAIEEDAYGLTRTWNDSFLNLRASTYTQRLESIEALRSRLDRINGECDRYQKLINDAIHRLGQASDSTLIDLSDIYLGSVNADELQAEYNKQVIEEIDAFTQEDRQHYQSEYADLSLGEIAQTAAHRLIATTIEQQPIILSRMEDYLKGLQLRMIDIVEEYRVLTTPEEQ